MESITSKFGGSSLANAAQFKKVKAIVENDPLRRFVVPSAPGKENPEDTKVTDLLYLLYDLSSHRISTKEIRTMLEGRFFKIVEELGLSLNLKPYFQEIFQQLEEGTSKAYLSSRGEFLNGMILAEYLGYDFVDAAKVIRFTDDGRLDGDRTYALLEDMAKNHERAVIPGFYGADSKGEIHTFTRGGGDFSGAVVARGVGSRLYENWTDVSGFLAADPRIVKSPRHIEALSYKELRELAYMGAGILHDEAIFPVISVNIPILIKNTNAPNDKGTLIVRDAEDISEGREITGVAGRKNFSVITLEKVRMNREAGFYRRVMSVLEANDIVPEHMPSSIDSLSLIISDAQLQGKRDLVLGELRTLCSPDTITVSSDVALIAVVGRRMINHIGAAAKLFTALSQAGINIRMIIQGSSEMNIIVGIDQIHYNQAIDVIYHSFTS